MIDIKINITNKIANAIGTPFIVCGNSDYTVTFTFDAEWGAYQEKTARFFFVADGIEQYIDVLFSGNTCNAPVLPNIEKVLIGVYTGNLRTTTGAEVRCKRSILFGGKVHEPPTTEDVYNEILEIVSKKLGSEGGTVTGDYYKDGNTFIHEGNLDLLDNHFDNRSNITATATGSAITIESSKAPLQNLKLYGKTEQDGTPTPDNPIELKSVGDSGSYNVDLYGKNMLEFIATTQTIKGVTFTVNADKSITVNGTPTENIYYLVALIRNETLRSNFILKGGVAGSFDTCIFYIASYNETGIEVDGNADYWGNGVKLNLKGVIGNVNILVKAGHTVNTTFYPILCHESLINTPYEPCKAKQTLINTDTLRGIGDIADEKDFARGMKTQRFGVVDLGTLNWQEQEAYKGCFLAQILGMSQKWSKGICSCYPFSDDVFTWLMANACADNTLYRAENDYVYIKDLSFPDATAFKSAMNGKYFVYELETPIETPISESELNAYRHLMTNKGTTTILSDADTEITYYVNKPNAQAIGSLHEQINKDYFKLQQAIISTGGN